MDINGTIYCSRCMRVLETEGQCPYCGYHGAQKNDSSVLEEGTFLNGKYQLGGVIGKGGFGITYAAWDENLDRPVAVKEYFPSDFVDRNINESDEVSCKEQYKDIFLEGRLRFERESRILSSLQEIPNVEKVFDYFSENNTAYLVMEYVHGASLDTWVKDRTMKPVEILQFMRPVIDTMILLHQQGIVHRDLKPDNIIVQEDGTPVIIDFGAAMRVGQHGETIVLSRGYAPVEQYGSEYGRQGPWSDVYGLAAIYYYLLTGEEPKESLVRSHNDDLKSPVTLGVKIGKKLDSALLSALTVKPENRTQSMDEFRSRLYNLPLPEQVLWRKRMQRRMIIAFCAIMILALIVVANFTCGLPLGGGLLYSLRSDGWHIIREWRSQSQRELPGKLLGLPVTTLEKDAFRADAVLEEITIREYTQTIGDQAFYGCSNLKTVHLNETIDNIGLNAFDGTSENLLIWGSRNGYQEVYSQSNSLRFVDGSEMDFEEVEGGLMLTRLESEAEDLVIPSYVNGEAVVKIGEDIEIANARSIEFPEHLVEIPLMVCLNNSKLETIILYDDLRRIEDSAFACCEKLSTIRWGEGLEEIGYNAFEDCTSLRSLMFPQSLKTIRPFAFFLCTGLQTVYMEDNVETIGEQAFRSCTSLSEVKLSEGIKEISWGTFYHSGLTSIHLPRALEQIGGLAFSGTNIQWILIPEKVRWVDLTSFDYCPSLQWVEFLSDSFEWTDIGHTYYNATSSEMGISYGHWSVQVVFGGRKGSSAQKMAEASFIQFEDIDGWTEGIETDGEQAVFQNVTDRIVIVPWYNEEEDCPIRMTLNAPAFCSGDSGKEVEEIRLPLFQTIIHKEEFILCKTLKIVRASGSIISIEDSAFEDCEVLEYIETNRQLQGIGVYAFKNTNLSNIDCSGVEEIGSWAFDGCSKLEKITFTSALKNVGLGILRGTSIQSLTIPGTLINLSGNPFSYMSKLEYVIVEEGIEYIESSGLSDCQSLKILVLPDTVKCLSEMYGLSGIDEIWIYNPDMRLIMEWPNNDPKVTLYGYTNSTTETFAQNNGYMFKEINVEYNLQNR